MLRLRRDATVADLPAHGYSVSALTPGYAVAEELEQRPGLPGVIIESDEKEPTVISRQRFFQQMSRGFSREIYLKRPIGLLARALPHATLRLDEDCPIGAAAARALERPLDQVYEPALIHGRDGRCRLLDAYVLLLAQTRLLELANRTIQQQKEEAEGVNRKLRETQAALIQSEKLASLGQLAAGMSHEINNPIAFVSTNVGVLFQEVEMAFGLLDKYRAACAAAPIDPGSAAALARLEEQIDFAYTQANYERQFRTSLDGLRRIREIVRNLCDFARLDRAEWQEINVNDCLRATLEMLCHELKRKDIRLETDYGTLRPALVQPGKINQVLLNLLMNALQASTAGGAIRVATHGEPDGVCIAIQDSGCGIPAEHLPRLFEPFFTTKPVGQGTGLGLSISYGIVREHGGAIEVDSVLGQGSIFRIRLPFHPPAHDGDEGRDERSITSRVLVGCAD
jgi:signal transduction histidine kinase